MYSNCRMKSGAKATGGTASTVHHQISISLRRPARRTTTTTEKPELFPILTGLKLHIIAIVDGFRLSDD